MVGEELFNIMKFMEKVEQFDDVSFANICENIVPKTQNYKR